MGFLADPALGLVDEAVFVVVDPDGAERAFAEIEDFVARRRTLAGDGGGLIVAVQVILVRPVADRLALQEFVADVGVAGDRREGRQPVEAGKDAVLARARASAGSPAPGIRPPSPCPSPGRTASGRRPAR